MQGLTEFLPVSSSGHLLLPAALFGWADQGLGVDIAVHLGTLTAVIAYLRKDLWALCLGCYATCRGKGVNADSKLALQLILATVPAGLAGVILQSTIQAYGRDVRLVAITSLVFALLLWAADVYAKRLTPITVMNAISWRGALFIGLAQALALIPGTSRSGVTLTAARFLGVERAPAARFSFLLSIPIILASGLLLVFAEGDDGSALSLGQVLYPAVVAGFVAFLTIHFFLRMLPRVGVLPFVVYRVVLGMGLLLWLA